MENHSVFVKNQNPVAVAENGLENIKTVSTVQNHAGFLSDNIANMVDMEEKREENKNMIIL